MKKCIRYISLIIIMFLSACGNGSSVEDSFYRNKIIENMKSASLWIIEEGVNIFLKEGKNGIHRKLVDEWGVQIWVDPWVETERYLAQFRIKARGINYDIHNLYRERVGYYFYEFWLIKIAAEPWSGEKNRSVFFITKTDNIYGSRKIIEHSDQFINRHQVEESKEIYFPVDNLELLYDMQAWLFPDSYKNTDLKNIKVVMDIEGKITLEH